MVMQGGRGCRVIFAAGEAWHVALRETMMKMKRKTIFAQAGRFRFEWPVLHAWGLSTRRALDIARAERFSYAPSSHALPGTACRSLAGAVLGPAGGEATPNIPPQTHK
jgi:hypothetical protein